MLDSPARGIVYTDYGGNLMYKISEFSRITKITVKALRYYDEEMILSPSHRDENNSYRYYDENDFHKAQLIGFLRDLGFSIAEIKEVLSCCENKADLSYYLMEKREQIKRNMEKEHALIKKINSNIQPQGATENTWDYNVEIKEFPAVLVATIRFKGNYDDMGEYIKAIFKAVKNNVAGSLFSLSYDSEYKEETDIEICLPITKSIDDITISVKTLPAIKAISTTHKGSYVSSNLAYKALLDYANEKKLQLRIPSMEVYVKGPGMIFRGNENNYITEIIMPIKEDEHD